MSTDKTRRPGGLVVVGREEIVVPFRAAGIECAAVEPADAARKVMELISSGCAVIFYTADLSESLEPLVHSYSGRTEPSLVELPSDRGGGGAQRIREVVRRAAGIDILAEEQMVSAAGGAR